MGQVEVLGWGETTLISARSRLTQGGPALYKMKCSQKLVADLKNCRPNEIPQQTWAPCVSEGSVQLNNCTQSSGVSQTQLRRTALCIFILRHFQFPPPPNLLPSQFLLLQSPLVPPLPTLHLVIISVHTGIISLENESLLKFCILLIFYVFWESLFRAEIWKEMWRERRKKAFTLGRRTSRHRSSQFHTLYPGLWCHVKVWMSLWV